MPQDLSLFTEGLGSEVIWGMADYWVSRVTWDQKDQSYHLLGKRVKLCALHLYIFYDCSFSSTTSLFVCFALGVMPPDEYYYDINDSVYTNTVAKSRC